jgi:hypothetical protein
MCIIAIKQAGLKGIDKDILENCFDNNPDGAGIMYNDNGKVVIKKGFMRFEDLWQAVRCIKKIEAKTVVYHFRIGTSGGNVAKNTHPFPISEKTKDLEKLEVVTDIGFAHNGVIDIDVDKGISDTMTYIKRIAKFKGLIGAQDADFLALMGLSTKGSRLTILYPNGTVITTGNGWIVDNGITYSNGTYKAYFPVTNWKDWKRGKDKDKGYSYGYEDDKPLFEDYEVPEGKVLYCTECNGELESYGDWLLCPYCNTEYEYLGDGKIESYDWDCVEDCVEDEDEWMVKYGYGH